jgi:hypothetical protein
MRISLSPGVRENSLVDRTCDLLFGLVVEAGAILPLVGMLGSASGDDNRKAASRTHRAIGENTQRRAPTWWKR